MLPKGMIARVHEYIYASPQFRGEVMRALRAFFDRPQGEDRPPLGIPDWAGPLFNEWFLFHFVLRNGRTPLEEFIALDPCSLPDEALALYRDLRESRYGLHEVRGVEIGEGLTLKDLRTGARWRVREFTATFTLRKGLVCFARIGRVGDHWELVGSDPVSVPRIDAAARRLMRDGSTMLTPKDAYALLQRWR